MPSLHRSMSMKDGPHIYRAGSFHFMARKNFVAATALLLYLPGGLVKVYINIISLDPFLSYLL